MPPEYRNESSSCSPITSRPPVRACRMLSIPSRSAVPGATISRALTSRGSWRLSSSVSSSPDLVAIRADSSSAFRRGLGSTPRQQEAAGAVSPTSPAELAVEAERDVVRHARPGELAQGRGVEHDHRGRPALWLEHDAQQHAVVLLGAPGAPDVDRLAGIAVAPGQRLAGRHVDLHHGVEEVRARARAPDVAIRLRVHAAVVDPRKLEVLVREPRV